MSRLRLECPCLTDNAMPGCVLPYRNEPKVSSPRAAPRARIGRGPSAATWTARFRRGLPQPALTMTLSRGRRRAVGTRSQSTSPGKGGR